MSPDSAFDQAIKAFKEIVTAIEALGGKEEDIVRIRTMSDPWLPTETMPLKLAER